MLEAAGFQFRNVSKLGVGQASRKFSFTRVSLTGETTLSNTDIYIYLNTAFLFPVIYFVNLITRKSLFEGVYFFFIVISIPLLFFSSFFDILNFIFLLSTMYLLARNAQKFIGKVNPKKNKTILVVILMIIAILLLRNYRGWQSVISTVMQYWLLFFIISVYLFSHLKSRVVLPYFIFALGVLLFSKTYILIALIYIIFDANIALSRKIYIFLLFISILLLSVYIIDSSYFVNFIENSVFRDGYQHDTKILGLSDGNRINIWSYYLDSSKLIGSFEYDLPDYVLPHNIFVNLFAKFGMVYGLFFSLCFLIIVFNMRKLFGYRYVVALFITFNLSAISDFSLIWGPSLLLFWALSVFKIKF